MSLALLCPGQGGQHAAMFDVVASEPDIDRLMRQANAWTGFDVVATLGADPATLFVNAVAQPLVCAYQGAIWSLLEGRLARAGIAPICIAGYSVGELAAYGCAGALSWIDTVALARRRADAMDAAGGAGDGLAAIRGLARPVLDALLAGREAFVAIVNGDDQFIVGGVDDALVALERDVLERGGVAQRLPVAVAAHTPRLASAVDPFRERLATATWARPRVPVLAGIDGSAVRDAAGAIDALSRQLAETVRWSDCIDALVERGATVCLELGPGAALSRMVRDRHAAVEVRSVADFRRLDAVVDWVVRATG